MNIKITPAALAVTILALAGCANNGPHGGHTEKWYETHSASQTAEIIWCGKQSVTTEQGSKSCRAANGAAKSAELGAQAISNAFITAQQFVVSARVAATAGQTTQTSEMNKTGVGGCANITVTPTSIGPTTGPIATITLNSRRCSSQVQGNIDKLIGAQRFGGGFISGKHFHIASKHGNATIVVNAAGAVTP